MLLKVDIIMATYNGAKYIENQILSILQQTHKDWNLYIHDDGSSDNTVNIIRKYAKLDSRIFFIDDNVSKLGAGKNFLHALRSSKEKYAIFCDQDDVWLENKIEELLREIEKSNSNDEPVLIYSDGYSWDEDGFIHQESISTEHAKNLQDFIMFNGGYQGCSIMMNKSLIELTKRYSGYVHHHDDLVSLIAHTFGKVKFYPKQLMLYRQHGEAVTGNKDFKKRKFYGVFNNAGYVISKAHYRSKTEFYSFFENEMSVENKNIFRSYFEYCSEKNRFKRALKLRRSSLSWGGDKNKILAKTLIQRLFDK